MVDGAAVALNSPAGLAGGVEASQPKVYSIERRRSTGTRARKSPGQMQTELLSAHARAGVAQRDDV